MELAQTRPVPKHVSKTCRSVSSRISKRWHHLFEECSDVNLKRPHTAFLCFSRRRIIRCRHFPSRSFRSAFHLTMLNHYISTSIVWTFIFFTTVNISLVIAEGNQTADLGAPPPPICDKAQYGTPNIEDCKTAMSWIPYFDQPAGRHQNEATAFRTFAEPQFLKPPFSPVRNEWAPRAIVQLPKIWKHSMPCNSVVISL